MTKTTVFSTVLLLSVLGSERARAQLSPGELHQSHAFLEGVKNCTQCHDSDQKLAADKCLACHTVLKARIDKGEGIHNRPEFKECQSCHVEHQGRNFQLVWFKGGEEKFDHTQTGYVLEGKHSAIKCQSCHQAKFIMDKEKLLEEKKDLQKTFLGLGRNCADCHLDEHRGQFAGACLSCHTMAGWRPAPGFDHNKTKFILTGKHTVTPCAKCHTTVAEADPKSEDKEYLRFANVAHQFCTDCHKDPHSNRFGGACEKCHTTESWKLAQRSGFDHGRQTRYPLLGKHAALNCESCHRPGRPLAGLKFEKCMDCHSDYHRGDFVRRPSRGVCEACHTVASFSPTLFTLAQHQKTVYPLRGAHLAVPCIACHALSGTGVERRSRFHFASTRCVGCHPNPHGTIKKIFADKGCELCHKVESWGAVHFDHSRTGYPLIGRHMDAFCRSCHAKAEKKAPPDHLIFTAPTRQCSGCHNDVHRGQFRMASAGGGSKAMPCERCHTPNSWQAEKFNHNTQAAFKLEGAHQKVPCRDCHKPTRTNGDLFVRYKPLSTACRSCHADPGKLRKKSG